MVIELSICAAIVIGLFGPRIWYHIRRHIGYRCECGQGRVKSYPDLLTDTFGVTTRPPRHWDCDLCGAGFVETRTRWSYKLVRTQKARAGYTA